MTVRRDDELAIAAADGDELAYREIIARYAPAIYDFATRASGDFRTGLTTTLAVFAEVPKPGVSVRAALFRKARQLLGELSEVSERSSVWGSLADRPWPEAEDDTPASSEAQQVWDAVRSLDLNTYMTFDLDTQRGLGSEELATVLGISKGHAATAAARARETVRTAVANRLLIESEGCDDLATLAESPHLVQKHLVGCATCQAARAGLTLPGMTLPVFFPLQPPADFVAELGKGAVVVPLPTKRRRPRLFIATLAVGLVAILTAAAIAGPLISANNERTAEITTSTASMPSGTTTAAPPQTTAISELASALPAIETTTTVPQSTTTSFPFVSFPFPASPTTTVETTTTAPLTSTTSSPPEVTTTTAAVTTSTTAATTTTVAPASSTTAVPSTTTTTTTTAVPNGAPQVSIEWPLTGAKVCEERVLNFSGSVTDPDGDGIVARTWSSSLDGTLGTGRTTEAALSVGTHTITFSATDSFGATGSTSISLQVQPATAPAC